MSLYSSVLTFVNNTTVKRAIQKYLNKYGTTGLLLSSTGNSGVILGAHYPSLYPPNGAPISHIYCVRQSFIIVRIIIIPHSAASHDFLWQLDFECESI